MNTETIDLILTSRPKQKSNVMGQEVLEEMVVYDAETEIGYSLNGSARSIWDLCDGTRSVEEICRVLAEPLDVSSDLLHEDVTTLVKELSKLGLLVLDEQEDK